MKSLFLSVVVAFILMEATGVAGTRISFEELVLRNEQSPQLGFEAKELAARLGLPKTAYLANGVLVDALGIEDGRPVYSVITNAAHPFDGGMAMFFEDVQDAFPFDGARINPTSAIFHYPMRGSASGGSSGYLLVPDWTADKVMAFDPLTGDLIDTAYIHSSPGILASPKEARLSPPGTITVSDQITDLVQNFDTAGTYINYYAPAGGVNTAILDNIRGHAYRPSNNNLVVAVASGANQNCVAEFDASGTYIGQFIAAGAGGLNSPFGILFRTNDVLVTASSSPAGVHRYDHSGASLGQWASITSFPQQIIQLAGGDIAVANFSGTGSTGIRLYKPDGQFIRVLTGATGNRGVYQLPNGRFLTTNSAGIHEIDTSGALVRTIATGSNMQYINHVPRTLVDVKIRHSIPQAAVLYQNYPNPFNPTTTIRYTIPQAANVRLTLHDVLGREIRVLLSGDREAGEHSLTISGEGLASGVYFYSIKAGNFVSMKRMVLLK